METIHTQTFRNGGEYISWSANNIPLLPRTADTTSLAYELSGEEVCSHLQSLSFQGEVVIKPECVSSSKIRVEIFR